VGGITGVRRHGQSGAPAADRRAPATMLGCVGRESGPLTRGLCSTVPGGGDLICPILNFKRTQIRFKPFKL
jgi:hypothetical protein